MCVGFVPLSLMTTAGSLSSASLAGWLGLACQACAEAGRPEETSAMRKEVRAPQDPTKPLVIVGLAFLHVFLPNPLPLTSVVTQVTSSHGTSPPSFLQQPHAKHGTVVAPLLLCARPTAHPPGGGARGRPGNQAPAKPALGRRGSGSGPRAQAHHAGTGQRRPQSPPHAPSK